MSYEHRSSASKTTGKSPPPLPLSPPLTLTRPLPLPLTRPAILRACLLVQSYSMREMESWARKAWVAQPRKPERKVIRMPCALVLRTLATYTVHPLPQRLRSPVRGMSEENAARVCPPCKAPQMERPRRRGSKRFPPPPLPLPLPLPMAGVHSAERRASASWCDCIS